MLSHRLLSRAACLMLHATFITARLLHAGSVGNNSLHPNLEVPTVTVTQLIEIFAPKAGANFKFEVTVISTAIPPTGQVVINVDGQDISAVNLMGGKAQVLVMLNAGGHTISAKYSGDANHAAATGTLSLSVPKNMTFMQAYLLQDSLPLGISSTNYGQQAQIQVFLTTGPRAGFPSGSLLLYIDGILNNSSYIEGAAKLNLPRLIPGTYTATLVFKGSVNFEDAASQPIGITITKGKTLSSLSASTNSPIYGEAVTISGKFWVPFTFVEITGGKVAFTIDGKPAATLNLINEVAEYTTSSLLPGSHTIQANLLANDLFDSGPIASTQITITSPGIEADVSPRPNGNNDGTVTIADWVQVGRFIAGLDTPLNDSEFQRIDCAPAATKGDGRLSLIDWVQAGRYAAGLDRTVTIGGALRPPSTFAPVLQAQAELSPPDPVGVIRALSGTLKRNEISTVQLELESAGGANALSFTFNFDPRLFSFSQAQAAEGWQLVLNEQQAAKGRLGILLSQPAGQRASAGKQNLLKLSFLPKGGNDSVTTRMSFDDQMFAREAADVTAWIIAPIRFEEATFHLTGRTAAIVNAASYANAELAPDSIASAFGDTLANFIDSAFSQPLPTAIANTSVKITDRFGREQLAPLFFVSPTQINFLTPHNLAEGPAVVSIISADGKETKGLVQIKKTVPSLFSANATGAGIAAAQTVRVDAAGNQSFEAVARLDAAAGKFIAAPINLGPDRGVNTDRVYLVLYGTAIRQRTNLDQVRVKIGKTEMPVEYAGAQSTFAGVDQINVLLPRDLIGQGEVQILLTVEGQVANVVTIFIQ